MRLIICIAIILNLQGVCFGWVHLRELRGEYYKSHLTYKIFNDRQIDYCIQLSDRSWNEDSLDIQIVMAIETWLTSNPDFFAMHVAINKVGCDDPNMDLQVLIGKDDERWQLGAFQSATKIGTHYFSRIQIISDFQWKDNGTGKIYFFQNFMELSPAFDSHFLEEISIKGKATLEQVAKNSDVDYFQIFWSTYRVLLHELGHSFGLGDTYTPEIDKSGDREFRSEKHPSSMMNDSNYFYITDDDKDGIKSLILRFGQIKTHPQ
ncbi:MAG: hypothetical protein A2504_14375 [Bdellovibrionales bacterium RIFOXYD12_FULL_39_22]|nr:MAG: hypothetical protein A2385_04810 [Bdellovibrionales bacterium RIFOXYB1_FULL_39_21]OFZ43469.1 MAG: hypothetical protein A2485_13325 [Bdellovibrionales bacterium RIFOXYC12_FULL_39_17]OFZ47012.1 MAG: hypothetical protein A2404_00385 [Bdellovibrionales bacterium RIFOXYC1_FULL_39_130]OFZ73072.1 MAG: hypothetical protein A2451_08065 [Bdellovibrionales bacterium RIFOXYC2_FULL_39_8]OFZ76209.1 MAG: hypothetical protein A2560_07635 [Bdellovibrionales bacterium RIFOXYD1_FULL_39_84]OFZ94444.1 MAG: